MAVNSRRKGADGERSLAKILREYGYLTERTAQYCGKTGEAADIRGLPGIHIECKRVEKLNLSKAMQQAENDARDGEIPCVFHRKNREKWKVTMNLDDFMKMYERWSDAGDN